MKRLIPVLFTLALLATACGSAEEPDLGLTPTEEEEERLFNLAQDLEEVAAFAPGQNPESVATDLDGNRYVSISFTGQILKIDPEGVVSELAVIPLGQPTPECGPFGGIQGALATDWEGHLYASVASCNAADRGVWRIDMDDGDAERIAALPFNSLPNGVARYMDDLYVADSYGAVWKVPKEGGEAELWILDAQLAPTGWEIEGPLGLVPVPGANGLQFYGNDLYISNSSARTLLRTEVNYDGTPDPLEVYHEIQAEETGCDDFAIDLFRRIYCTTDPSHTFIRIDPDGDEVVLYTGEDGLDGPTSAAFGRGTDRHTLYVANAAFGFFYGTGHGPRLLQTQRLVPGYPFR